MRKKSAVWHHKVCKYLNIQTLDYSDVCVFVRGKCKERNTKK